jgi:hypothetical protein
MQLRSVCCLNMLGRRKWDESVRNGKLRERRTEETGYKKERVKWK